jgi:site-specific DNA-cytosine methylase
MRLLELFSGTGSIGVAFEKRGFEVISVDIDPKSNPTFCCDILEFDYRQFPPGHFDVVWASPPCTMYSRARTTAKTPRDLLGADRLVAKTREIIG